MDWKPMTQGPGPSLTTGNVIFPSTKCLSKNAGVIPDHQSGQGRHGEREGALRFLSLLGLWNLLSAEYQGSSDHSVLWSASKGKWSGKS